MVVISSCFFSYFFQILTGHQDNAEFALAMCPTEPFVLSGGQKPLMSQSILFCVCASMCLQYILTDLIIYVYDTKSLFHA